MNMGLRAAWRRAAGSFWDEIQREGLSRWQLLGLGLSFLTGFLLTWVLSVALQVRAGTGAASPAAVASSYVLTLSLLCVCFALLPRNGSRPGTAYWGHLCAWFQTVDLALAAFLGVWLAPGSGLGIVTAVVLSLIVCAYAAALCGAHALLCVIRGGPSEWCRAGLAVVLALAITALLWTRAPLQALQRTRAVAAYDSGTQAVAVLSPTMGLSAYWNGDPARFNLTKTTHTYQLWLGPSFISFPRLWPGRSGLTEEDRGLFGPGLVLGLMIWGVLLALTGDLVSAMRSCSTSERAPT